MTGTTMTATGEEIPINFDFETAQPRLMKMWQDAGLFHAEPDPSRTKYPKGPFTIVIPPPNVTGALHLGHALNNTLQDIVIRMKRMQGFNTLWMPGTDHAGIATQAVVERRLKEEENKTRHDLGREALVDRIWDWKAQYEKRIIGQLKQMGCSCDWERLRFTFDDVCARAVRHTFFDLFKKQLIYRGKRLVNWDTYLQTAVSDDEVFSKKTKGSFWHFRYPVVNPKPGEPTHVTVATTRPETMLGDTAVAVHPDPARALDKVETALKEKLASAKEAEKESIQQQIDALEQRRRTMLGPLEQLRDMAADGRTVMLPLMDREIPIVADTWAKPELGSGCVKITPAHDPNDYEVAKRTGVSLINIMNTDGTLNAETGGYAGLHAKQARKKVVEDLDALGLLGEIEDREIELPHSDRSKTPIEPLLADQWFVKMDALAQSAMDAVSDSRVTILPERYSKGYLDWLSEKRDWPVSRQLWWGHQIPVWSIPVENTDEWETIVASIKAVDDFDLANASIQIEESNELDEARRKLLELPAATVHVCVQDEGSAIEQQLTDLGLIREKDVLDTWFSSALWPHSTLGWPDKTPELDYFYPTSTLITSRDILTLWVARMVLTGLNNCSEIPFDRVFIHPKILDGNGETMSKSKGNGIDPLDVIEKFGTDALRYAMARLTTDTQDVRMPVQFECPLEGCKHRFDQKNKHHEKPRVECPSCKKEFSTQFAKSDDDLALPRGLVLSERFEDGARFANKLWNASRFAMMNLEGYSAAPISDADLTIEDRWILSRLSTVANNVTGALENFRYAEATRELYDYAWNDFCSFYVEMLKDRFADPAQRPHAQRMMAFALDSLLRLLHPIMPFITEEIWQQLAKFAPERGFDSTSAVKEMIQADTWPELPASWQNAVIENQFSKFKGVLGEIREIRNSQNIPPKKAVRFSIRCHDEDIKTLQPMSVYFGSMAAAEMTDIGPDVIAPKISATRPFGEMEVHLDLDGLIDKEAECKRLEKEREKILKMKPGKEAKLANEKFVSSAPPEIVDRERNSLALLREQLQTIEKSLADLAGDA